MSSACVWHDPSCACVIFLKGRLRIATRNVCYKTISSKSLKFPLTDKLSDRHFKKKGIPCFSRGNKHIKSFENVKFAYQTQKKKNLHDHFNLFFAAWADNDWDIIRKDTLISVLKQIST